MDIPLFIHSSLGGHLDCFHLLATVNNSAIDIHAGVFGFFFQWGPFLKSLLNLLQYCFCPTSWPFGQETCGIPAPLPEIRPALLESEGKVPTTGPPGKSRAQVFVWTFVFISLGDAYRGVKLLHCVVTLSNFVRIALERFVCVWAYAFKETASEQILKKR